MKIKHILLVAFISIGVINNYPQDYWPLQIGNVTYISNAPEIIVDTLPIDGKTYFKSYDSYNYHYIRKDASGNIYYRFDNTEYLYVQLNANIGDTWLSGTIYPITVKLESKTDVVVTKDTTFFNCYRYAFYYHNIVDANYAIYLAPNVGIVKDSSLDWGLSSVLTKALINGKRIPSKLILPEITKTIPADLQADIPVDVQLTVLFDVVMQKDLLNDNNIKIISKKRGILPFHFNRSYGNSDIRFIPDEPFEYNDNITVILLAGLCDYMNDHLREDFKFTFNTEEYIPEPDIFSKDTLSIISNLSWGDFDFADYDNDGDIDLIVQGVVDTVNSGMEPKVELYENIYGKLIKKDIEFNAVRNDFKSSGIKWIDFNNDGFMDIVFSGQDKNYNPLTQFYKNSLNNFILIPEMNLNFGKASMEWYDFNKDGYKDLAISGTTQPKINDIVIYKNNNGNLEKYTSLKINTYHPGIHKWIDINQDGFMDIIKTGYQFSDTKFFINNNVSFSELQININDNTWLPYHYNIDYSDIDKDGDLDLLIGSKLLIHQDNNFITDDSQIDTFNDAFVKFFDFNNDSFDDVFLIGRKYDNIERTRTYIQIYQNINGSLSLITDINLKNDIYLFSARWLDINNDNKIDLAAMTSEGFLIYYNIMNPTLISNKKYEPSNFSLSQNFPNPFNPATKIKYSIPSNVNHQPSTITLKVYDILGNEVATLVNEEQSAGEYEVELDGGKLASGIYFYVLNIGNQRLSRKMCLIK